MILQGDAWLSIDKYSLQDNINNINLFLGIVSMMNLHVAKVVWAFYIRRLLIQSLYFGYRIVSSDDTIIHPLDLETGVPFITDQWIYAVQGTDAYLPEVLKRNHSMGVYAKDKAVSGVVIQINGTIGGLNTLEEFRRRGCGQNCIQALMKMIHFPLQRLRFQSFMEWWTISALPGKIQRLDRAWISWIKHFSMSFRNSFWLFV